MKEVSQLDWDVVDFRKIRSIVRFLFESDNVPTNKMESDLFAPLLLVHQNRSNVHRGLFALLGDAVDFSDENTV
jgi:hypothetical protein